MPAISKHPTRGKNNVGRKGRPKTWTGALIREMIALEIHTNFTNDELLRSLRGTEEGTRSLQGQRKRLLGNRHQRWRPRDAQQMHRRIRHLQAQDRPGTGPRPFSLDSNRPRQRATTATTIATEDSTRHPSPSQRLDTSRIVFQVVRQPQQDSGEMKPLRIRKVSTGGSFSTNYLCEVLEVDQKLNQLCQESTSSSNDRVLFSWSVILSDVDLNKHKFLETDGSFEALHNRTTKLALNHCRLYTVPPPVKFFARLRYLNLKRNKLVRIPTNSLPTTLTHLDLRNNEVIQLPEELLSLESLQVLAVSHNLIKELPSWLSRWISLRSFLVNGNPLNTLSQSYYRQAFQRCTMDTKLESCTFCVALATETLKGLLSPNFSRLSDGASQKRSCDCVNGDMPTNTQLVLAPNNDLRSFERDLFRTAAYSRGATGLRDFLSGMSLLSGSTRSSVSERTLKSLSSISSRRRLSRQDIQSLMNVHCCFREVGDIRPPCMHFRIAKWISSKDTRYPPLIALQQLDPLGNSALHVAAGFGASPAALRSCIDSGCPPNIINHDGETFLHRVSSDNWHSQPQDALNLTRLLYTMKFPFEHRDNRGNSIFHRSDRSSLQRVTWRPESIFKNGPQLNDPSNALNEQRNSSSQVYFECTKHRPSIEHPIRLFVKESRPMTGFPNFAYRDLSSCTAECTTECTTECSRIHQNPLHELADLAFLGYERFLMSRYILECSLGTVLCDILALGIDVKEYNNQGSTVLMAFIKAFGRHRKLSPIDVEHYVSTLLSSGANARSISSTGNTVLHHAVYHGVPFVIEPLIKAGANVNARNDEGLSVMQLLTETMRLHKSNIHLYGSYQQCMAILADHGAELDPTLKQELQWQGYPIHIDDFQAFF